MYSSIYRVQSSTRRLPIWALFGFTLKLVESYPSPSPQSLCVVVCPWCQPWVASSTADSLLYQACWLICLLIPLLSNESFFLCLLIHAYPLLTHRLQSPYCSFTNPPASDSFLLTIPCLLICLLIPYSYMLIPLLTDRLQTTYCSLTNPPFFYKYCLLPPCVYKLLLAVCQCKQLLPCFKAVTLPLRMSLLLYLFASVSPYQVSESGRSPVQV